MCEVLAAVIVLGALDVIPLNMSPEVRDAPWVAVCAGLTFAFAGAAVIVGFAVAGGAGPSANLPAGTPFWIQVVQYLLGLGIVGSMTAICTWVAFGSGPRRFSGGIGLPFITWEFASGDRVGRFVFGVCATLLWTMLVGLGIAGARRLIVGRPRRETPADRSI